MSQGKLLFRALSLALAALGLAAVWYFGRLGGNSNASIEIKEIPAENAGRIGSTPISGVVHAQSFKGLKVVIYTFAADRWWVQPYTIAPFTEIAEDGRWSNECHGGERYAALLVRTGYQPEAKVEVLPQAGGNVVAVALARQTRYTPLPGETKKQIAITHVPDAREGAIASTPLTGTAENADIRTDRVVVYALFEGKWRLQTYPWSDRGTITADGKWSVVVHGALEACIMPDPWYQGRVVLIGDAAHSATPHLGQGAAMAVEDAVVLAEELAERDLDEALKAFMTRRFERAKLVGTSSIQLGEWEMHPETAGDPVEVTDRIRKKLAEPV